MVWGDHGWHLGDQRVWGKHTIFEKALKSVLIVKAPKLGLTHKVINSVVETVDIYPSLMQLCNVDLPYKTDGESFIDQIRNPNTQNNNVAYSYFRNGISLRTDDYRLTKYFRKEEPSIELYDHASDPDETRNIAQSRPDIVQELMPLLDEGNTGLFATQGNQGSK